jgi:type I restriction-modification system DNA methylase subunit
VIEIHKLVKHFSDEEIDKVAATYHAWRGDRGREEPELSPHIYLDQPDINRFSTIKRLFLKKP